ncbi:MAG: MiaB/RimO family radical SAM methylthiotransferase [Oscillospiraceae bacterium]|nr:MiaB/RimO family radical SAM methylthiotransferase [Oscillospiraceae bacterium]
MKFNITTFGCKVNQYESSGIFEMMSQGGYIPVGSGENADIHIINSCTVTENSDRKVKGLILRLKKANPHTKIVLCGCFPKAFPDKAAAIGADIVVNGIFTGIEPDLALSLPYSPQSERTRAFLKIQDGCDRDCAYCIIPKARGSVKSRTVDDIREEAQKLTAAGHKEIVVTGINLCAYEYSLTNAVEAICGVDGAERVRLSSLEPDMITEEDIERLSKLQNLCPHFHLSLQSGSDTVLSRMKRRYTTGFYGNIVKSIRKSFRNAAITTDIIVGFPGESDDEFAQTLAFAEETGFAKIHVFAFSPREGTLAATMPNQVPEKLKRERIKALSESAREMREAFFKSLIGTEQSVLTESTSFGHTRCYTPVRIQASGHEKNSIVKLKIIGVEKDCCIGACQV